jgi:hypothetical protein
LISEHTIEENILKKANQKRQLDDVVIGDGCFTTDFFKRVDIRELFDEDKEKQLAAVKASTITEQDWVKAVSTYEEETDITGLLNPVFLLIRNFSHASSSERRVCSV